MDDLGKEFIGFPMLSLVRDLEAFEGPILTELADPDGALYLSKWCSPGRSLVVRSDGRAIARYLSRRSTMLELLVGPSDDVGFVVDWAADGTCMRAQLVQVSRLPSRYLPVAGCRHDLGLRPTNFLRTRRGARARRSAGRSG